MNCKKLFYIGWYSTGHMIKDKFCISEPPTESDNKNNQEIPDIVQYISSLNFENIKREDVYHITRGIFESSGYFNQIKMTCGFTINQKLFPNVYECVRKIFDRFTFENTETVDFLSKIYDCDVSIGNEISPKKQFYFNLLGYEKTIPKCHFKKTDSRAISPSKNNASDEGYDLWLIDIDKKISSDIIRFDTFIQVQPPMGFHIEILPRSSLSNSGYMLANSVGLIDSSYRGNLKVVLIKVDKSLPDIELPFKGVQAVLRKNAHFLVEETNSLTDTARGAGGFGSTN